MTDDKLYGPRWRYFFWRPHSGQWRLLLCAFGLHRFSSLEPRHRDNVKECEAGCGLTIYRDKQTGKWSD